MPTMDVYTRAKIFWLTEGIILGMGIPPSCSIQTSCWSKKPKSEQYQQGWIASCKLYIFPNKYMKKMRWGMAQINLHTPNWNGFCDIYISMANCFFVFWYLPSFGAITGRSFAAEPKIRWHKTKGHSQPSLEQPAIYKYHLVFNIAMERSTIFSR